MAKFHFLRHLVECVEKFGFIIVLRRYSLKRHMHNAYRGTFQRLQSNVKEITKVLGIIEQHEQPILALRRGGTLQGLMGKENSLLQGGLILLLD